MTPRFFRVSLLTFALAVAGCGGSQGMHGKVRPSSEFTPRDTGLFEDGVDLIEDPQGLEGQWRDDWENDLNERIARSDVIALGSVNTLNTDLDLEHQTSYRVVFAFEHRLVGEPPASELNLVSRGGAPGFSSIERDRANILNRKLVVFMKYAAAGAKGDTAVVTHFHLSPPSDVVLDRIGRFKESKEPSHVQVIEHTQSNEE
jgi:hypothetical protein